MGFFYILLDNQLSRQIILASKEFKHDFLREKAVTSSSFFVSKSQ